MDSHKYSLKTYVCRKADGQIHRACVLRRLDDLRLPPVTYSDPNEDYLDHIPDDGPVLEEPPVRTSLSEVQWLTRHCSRVDSREDLAALTDPWPIYVEP